MAQTWRAEWRALSTQMEGLLQAAGFYHNTSAGGRDTTPISSYIVPFAERIFIQIKQFYHRYRGLLNPELLPVLDSFLQNEGLFCGSGTFHDKQAIQRCMLLSIFRAEVDYVLSDRAATSRQLAERAFVHLCRTIVVDGTARIKWQTAFSEEKEIGCEKLGALHLLQHGIWAFKASSEGERTDLILQDRITDYEEVERVADALVLTEWKRITGSPKDYSAAMEREITRAQTQFDNYRNGSLAAIELHSVGYLVLVSQKRLKLRGETFSGERGTYRIVNIPVDPDSPGKR